MKYVPPPNGPSESGITAEIMYNSVRTLLREHATKDLYEEVKSRGLPPFKVWDTQPIRGELEELVKDYLFCNLKGALRDLRQNIELHDHVHQLSSAYFNQLFTSCGSIDRMKKEVSADFAIVTKHADTMIKEIPKIDSLNKPKLIRNATQDAFAQLSNIYGEIEVDLKELTLI